MFWVHPDADLFKQIHLVPKDGKSMPGEVFCVNFLLWTLIYADLVDILRNILSNALAVFLHITYRMGNIAARFNIPMPHQFNNKHITHLSKVMAN